MAEIHHMITIPGHLLYFTDVSPSTQTCAPVEGFRMSSLQRRTGLTPFLLMAALSVGASRKWTGAVLEPQPGPEQKAVHLADPANQGKHELR